MHHNIWDYGGYNDAYEADFSGDAFTISLHLQAGADPTIRACHSTALEDARYMGSDDCAWELEAAVVEPQRGRALFKARALVNASLMAPATSPCLADRAVPEAVQRVILGMAAPAFLKGRVEAGRALPAVSVGEAAAEEGKAEAAAVLRLVVGLEGPGLPSNVFMELLDMMVPKWDPARKGEPLGAYYERVEPGQGH